MVGRVVDLSMTLPAASSEVAADPVVAAIHRAGITGITAKQLSEVTQLTPDDVSSQLRTLSSRHEISRIGRGLWVLERFAVVNPSDSEFRGPAGTTKPSNANSDSESGGADGEIQFNPNEKRPVHRWWPYVQGFSAGFVADTCRRFGAGPGSVILDPFCGSGTVPVTARTLGAKGIGIDMMPIAAFVANAKCEWEVDPHELWDAAIRVTTLRAPPTIGKPFLTETDRQFAPEVLRSLLRLKQNIWALNESSTKTLLKLSFASILIDSRNLKRAPCFGYTKKLGLSGDLPYELFLESIRRTKGDLETLQQKQRTWGPRPDVRLGSSGVIRFPKDSVDLAITSPPYVNGMDYVMNYKIDLAWMGFIDSYQESRSSSRLDGGLRQHTERHGGRSSALVCGAFGRMAGLNFEVDRTQHQDQGVVSAR